MSEPFVTDRDYEVYRIPAQSKAATPRKGETPAQAKQRAVKKFYEDRAQAQARVSQRRSDDRSEHMAAHAAYDELRPKTYGSGDSRAIGKIIPERFRKVSPVIMDVAELSEGPNLPHRDDKDISTEARDRAAKAGYYAAATFAFSSDAYMDKPSPIDRKAGSKKKHVSTSGIEYVMPHGAGTDKPLTARNKHLMYKQDPTAREALANVMRDETQTASAGEPVADRYTLVIPRDMLVMLARVHDIQAERGKLAGDNRSDMLRELANRIEPGEMVDIDLYSPSEVTSLTQGLPKRYKSGEFGQFLKDLATFAKIQK